MSEVRIEIMHNLDIEILKPYAKNVFNHQKNVNDIANSILTFGYSKLSIGVDEEDILLYGHGTLQAIKLLNWTHVPMVARIQGLTDEKKKQYRVVDNLTSRRSEMINELVEQEFSKQLISQTQQ